MSTFTNPYISALQTFYNAIGTKYHSAGFHNESAQNLVAAAGPSIKQGSWVLDLATGTGNVAFAAASKVSETGRVLGIDISDEFIRLATEAAKQLKVDGFVEFLHRDVEDLDLPERYGDGGRCFDVVACGSAIAMFPDPGKVLHVVATQLLKKGGVFVADVPMWNVPARIFLDVAVPRGFKAPIDPGWLSDPESCFRRLFEEEVWGLKTVTTNELGSEGRWDVGSSEKVEKLWEGLVTEQTWVSFGMEKLDAEVVDGIKKAFVEGIEECKGEDGCIVVQRKQCLAVAVCKEEHVA
jgi:SAM-dependent methyltransferase